MLCPPEVNAPDIDACVGLEVAVEACGDCRQRGCGILVRVEVGRGQMESGGV